MKKIDLHCHTYHSDGQLSPELLVTRAHNMQVDVLAITDHDTIAGIREAQEYQSSQSRKLEIIPGIELSTAWHGFDIHILGLNVDVENQRFLERLKKQTNSRNERAQKIASKLEKNGVQGVLPKALALAGKGQITRAHFARALVELGAVPSFEQAFKKYLGKGKRAHVAPQWIDIETAIAWIHDAGGDAVIAHPGHYDLSAKWLRRLLSEFKALGGDGMEVSHPHLSPDRARQMAKYAEEYQLKASAGSDFHAPGRWTDLGRHTRIPEHLTPIWNNWWSSKTIEAQVAQ